MINYIRLACMLKTYRKCDLTVGFSKYEFNNKLLIGVTFFRVTSSVTYNHLFLIFNKIERVIIYIYTFIIIIITIHFKLYLFK